MTDLEGLLRETLRDERYAVEATPAHFAGVAQRVAARRRQVRRTRWVTLGAAAAAVLVVATAGVVARPQAQPLQPSDGLRIVRAPLGGQVERLPLPGVGTAVAVSGTLAWVLGERADGRTYLQRWDLVSRRPTGTVTLPGGAPGGVTVDGGSSVWVWTGDAGDPTVFTEYDAVTLRPLRTTAKPVRVYAAVAAGGALWVATGNAVLRVGPGRDAPVTVDAVEGATSLAVDPVHRRLVLADIHRVAVLDADSGAPLSFRALPSAAVSLAVSGDGHLWLAGRTRGASVVRLDPGTLGTVLALPGWQRLRAPLRVSAGGGVVWVSDDDGTLICVTAVDGTAREGWTGTPGPVVSDGGDVAVGVDGATLTVLPLDGCPG